MNPPIKVLHLEDSERDAGLIREMLEIENVSCDILRAATRAEFEKALARDAYDIVLTDHNLPDYDGVSALKAVRELRPLTPVIVVSGSLGEEEAVKCLRDGATDYLLKGRMERLVPAFKRALAEAAERRRCELAETELRRNEERMRLALAATNDGIWDWDLAQRRMVCNATFASLFGRPGSDEDPGAWWREHAHPEDRDAFQHSLDTAIATGSPVWAGSHRLLRSDGRWAYVHNRVCLAKNSVGAITRLVGAVQDISEQITADNERRTLEEQLRQAQKMEALGTLAGGIAHDFNNILGIIMCNAQLAQTDLPPDEAELPSIRESLSEILVAAGRARDLVKRILLFSRPSSSERKVIEIQSIIRECVKMLRSSLPAMVTINEQIDPDCPSVFGDPTHLHQVLMNICTNAWHALPESGGMIELRLDHGDLPPAVRAANPQCAAGCHVRLSIRDNGHGMDAATRARIFEPFFTTKPVGKGTGLGLSVVHGIVQAHGGAITVQSAPRAGTTFEIYLPARSEATTASAAAASPPEKGAGQCILVVDDDIALGKAVHRVLVKSGYNVSVLVRPEEAWETLRTSATDCDVLIVDYAMPGMSGLELAKRVRQLRPQLPIILVTGSMEVGDRKGEQLSVFFDVLMKPPRAEALCEMVARALRSRPPAPAR